MHGTNGAMSQPASAGNFVDPISSSIAAYDPQQPPSLPLQQSQQSVQVQPFHSHSIKPTSRKNRNSNMPNIGNPSSINMSDFGRPPNNSSQTRLNSMPTHSIVNQNRLRSPTIEKQTEYATCHQTQTMTFNQVPAPSLNNHVPTQRQFSSSTMIEVTNNNNKVNNSSSNPDISTNSVVHNAMQFTNTNNNTSSTVDINDPKNIAPPPTTSVSAPSTPTLSHQVKWRIWLRLVPIMVTMRRKMVVRRRDLAYSKKKIKQRNNILRQLNEHACKCFVNSLFFRFCIC